jgi:hypothetical protein
MPFKVSARFLLEVLWAVSCVDYDVRLSSACRWSSGRLGCVTRPAMLKAPLQVGGRLYNPPLVPGVGSVERLRDRVLICVVVGCRPATCCSLKSFYFVAP